MPRKKIDIDPELVKNYASLGANNCEIADFFNVSEATIRRRFDEILTKIRASRRIKLRELMWSSAQKGSIPMQIFLAKNYLGMSDRTEQINIDRKKEHDKLIVVNGDGEAPANAIRIN